MKSNRRWMKWVLEADANEVQLPWARRHGRQGRPERRKAFKTASAKRARAA